MIEKAPFELPIDEINTGSTRSNGISLKMLRLDKIHRHISGNKWFKLKYNLIEAKKLGHNTIVTFGGAYSNHIAATAYAGQLEGLSTVGIIRGEEHLPLNPTLSFARHCGMQIEYLDRESYRRKDQPEMLSELKAKHKAAYFVPEGGTNNLAVKGTQEILNYIDQDFDVITTSVGTGGTIAGIIKGLDDKQSALGFAALKGDFLNNEIRQLVGPSRTNWSLNTSYHFGGYAKYDNRLLTFMSTFSELSGFPLDPIYTGKMMFGLLELIDKGYFKRYSKIIALHTGGLQGIKGFENRYKVKL